MGDGIILPHLPKAEPVGRNNWQTPNFKIKLTNFMRFIILFLLLSISLYSVSQNRVNKVSLNYFDNFYSLRSSVGQNNSVVRIGDGMTLNFKTYDTVKKSGMIYELQLNTTNSYYNNVIGTNRLLNVEDLHLNFNFIFPMLLFYKKNLEQSIGVGIGVGTLAARDFLDENNSLLQYNSTTLKEISFGKHWTSSLLLDYEFNFKLTKRIGFNLGLRYSSASPLGSKSGDYLISQGTSIGIRYGLHYQFK